MTRHSHQAGTSNVETNQHAYQVYRGVASGDRRAELDEGLHEWHVATLRLQHTHELLRSEVCRLGEELESSQSELLRHGRLAELGQMASLAAHEARGNLAPLVRLLTALRRRVLDDASSLELIDRVYTGLSAIDTMLGDLCNPAADRQPELQWINVRQLIDEVCASLAGELDERCIETVTDVPRYLGVLADRNMMRSAVLNLAVNALEAMPRGGRLVITSFIGAGGLELEVADSGPGLSDEVRRRAFEPFFTTKNGGTGLGLAIVNRVAQAHGGSIAATNCPEGGAAFTLRFPQPARKAA